MQSGNGRVAVTGATGFVGRHLVQRLVGEQVPITLLVRDNSRCPSAWLNNPLVRVVPLGPLEAATGLEDVLEDARCVLHLAGLAHVRALPDAHASATEHATQRLVAAVGHRTKTFIFLSSIAAVTANASGGVTDDATRPCPVGPYGAAKLAAEAHVASLVRKGVFAVSLRPPLIVGAGAKGNWHRLQRLAASRLPLPFSLAGSKRAYLGITTLTDMLAHLWQGAWEQDKSGAYCLANAEHLSLAEVVSILREGMGLQQALFPLPLQLMSAALAAAGRKQMAQSLFGALAIDARRFSAVFGFKEMTSLRDDIRRSGALYKGHFADTHVEALRS